jgi:hypothetical protein
MMDDHPLVVLLSCEGGNTFMWGYLIMFILGRVLCVSWLVLANQS